MKRVLAGLLALLFLLLLAAAGCGAEEVAFNEEAFKKVSEYADEITMALYEAIPDLRGWMRDPGDEERLEWLKEHRNKLVNINRLLEADDFPAESEIKTWAVVISRDENEWLVRGREIVDTLNQMHWASGKMIELLDKIIATGSGHISDEEMEEMIAVIDIVSVAMEKMNDLFYRGI